MTGNFGSCVLARALLAHVEVLAPSGNLSTNQQRELWNTCCFGALSSESICKALRHVPSDLLTKGWDAMSPGIFSFDVAKSVAECVQDDELGWEKLGKSVMALVRHTTQSKLV